MAKKNTWGHLVGHLPVADRASDDITFEQAVQLLTDDYLKLPLDEQFVKFNSEAQDKAELGRQISDVNGRLEALTRAILKTMENQGVKSVTQRGYNWTPSPEPTPKVTDKAALREWALEHMPDSLNLHHGTLTSTIKKNLEEGEELPPGVEAEMWWSLSRTKA